MYEYVPPSLEQRLDNACALAKVLRLVRNGYSISRKPLKTSNAMSASKPATMRTLRF